MTIDPSILATIGVGAVVSLVGWLVLRAVKGVDLSVADLKADVKALTGSVHSQDTRLALLESRTARNETEIGSLHGRVSRLISDKLDEKGAG